MKIECGSVRSTLLLSIGIGVCMKKGQVLEGIVERVAFPNKGIVSVEGEEQKVIVKNAIEGQKIRFSINKKRKGKAE